MTRNTLSVGISFPHEMLKTIDKLRGDISRSRYILRLIEDGIALRNGNKNV